MAKADRTRAILAALDSARIKLREVRDKLEALQVEFEAARAEFVTRRRIAAETLPTREWLAWQEKHKDVRLVGLSIGDAILEVLRSKAHEVAWKYLSDPFGQSKPYDPAMTADEIVAALTEGGFTFQSRTPRREVAAALVHLKGVDRAGSGKFRTAEANEVISAVRELFDRLDKQREQDDERERQEDSAGRVSEDDVPF